MTWLSMATALLVAAPPTEADRLFAKGRALLVRHPAEACPLFEKSFELDPALGTLLNLALCLESVGKPASAWRAFNRALEWARRTHEIEREALASAHLDALGPKLAWVALSAARPIAGLEVQVDREKVLLMGAISLPFDPGTHSLSATAPGRKPWQTTVVAPPPGESTPVIIPELELDGPPPPPSPPPLTSVLAPAESTSRVAASHPPAQLPTGSVTTTLVAPAWRTPALALTAMVGGGVLVLGGAGGLWWSLDVNAKAQHQRLDQPITSTTLVSRSTFDTARVLFPVSCAALGVGAAVGVLGAWLWGRSFSPAPSVGVVPIAGGQLITISGTL